MDGEGTNETNGQGRQSLTTSDNSLRVPGPGIARHSMPSANSVAGLEPVNMLS